MTALAAAVMPIIRLLVAVATRSGTPIARCMSGTLMIPPPMPEERGDDAGAGRPDDAATEVADAVAVARQPFELGRLARRRRLAWRPVGVGGRRRVDAGSGPARRGDRGPS